MRTSKLLTTVLVAGMLAGCTSHKYHVYFKPGSSELTADSKSTLKKVAHKLSEHKFSSAKLYGFTDGTGSADMNRTLAIKRVNSVDKMLLKLGTDTDKIFTDTHYNKWIYAGEAKADQNQRRVDIRIYKFLWM